MHHPPPKLSGSSPAGQELARTLALCECNARAVSQHKLDQGDDRRTDNEWRSARSHIGLYEISSRGACLVL